MMERKNRRGAATMIEKRIGYQEDNGRKNVKAAELIAKKPLPKNWVPKYINGNVIDITPLINDDWFKIFEEEPEDDDSVRKIPRFRRKIPEVDINKYENYEVASGRNKEGIMKVASAEDEREFYGGLLSPVYKKDYLESLPINELKELFDQYLRDMSIG